MRINNSLCFRKEEGYMQRLKRFIILLLSMVVLCSSQLMYANAASAYEDEIMPLSITTQDVTKGGVTVTFYFDYSDGNSVKLAAVTCNNTNYSMPDKPTESLIGDKCYAEVVVIHNTTKVKTTFKAWCDIYGECAPY